jgi:hypothetical protein
MHNMNYDPLMFEAIKGFVNLVDRTFANIFKHRINVNKGKNALQ